MIRPDICRLTPVHRQMLVVSHDFDDHRPHTRYPARLSAERGTDGDAQPHRHAQAVLCGRTGRRDGQGLRLFVLRRGQGSGASPVDQAEMYADKQGATRKLLIKKLPPVLSFQLKVCPLFALLESSLC